MSEPAAIERAMLLCLDLQPVFLRAVADGPKVLRRCQFAVAAAVGLGMPVAFTEQVPAKLGGTEPALLALAPQATVHAKDTFSALARDSPTRETITAGRPTEHLILCGLETPVCVFQTAVDGLQAGLAVTVLSDGVAARRPEDAATCLAAMARAGIHVLPAETVFYSILRDTSHPFFRAYTALVKLHA